MAHLQGLPLLLSETWIPVKPLLSQSIKLQREKGALEQHYNELQKLMLEEFYDFVSRHSSHIWLHWRFIIHSPDFLSACLLKFSPILKLSFKAF